MKVFGNRDLFPISHDARLSTATILLAMLLCHSSAHAQSFTAADVIPYDDSVRGYTIDNYPLKYKEHIRLPPNSSVGVVGMIDQRYGLANVYGDQNRDYMNRPDMPVVIIDTLTGETKETQYKGRIECFVDGNLYLAVIDTRYAENPTNKVFYFYGKYGEALDEIKGRFPKGMTINRKSCTFQPRLTNQQGLTAPVADDNLRTEHGYILAHRVPDERMPVPAYRIWMDEEYKVRFDYFLRQPDGKDIPISTNPGEFLAAKVYLDYLKAYFLPPSQRFEYREAPTLVQLPIFARLLYPDGRVERFGIPDVLWEPMTRNEIYAKALYTKVGLVWVVKYVRERGQAPPRYRGELQEVYYLDQHDRKVLRKLPESLLESSNDTPKDGCRLGTRDEITQKIPAYLHTRYYIDLCEGEAQ